MSQQIRSRSAGSPPAAAAGDHQGAARTLVRASDDPVADLAALRAAVACADGGPSTLHLASGWAIDVALWIALMWRDYDMGMYQCTVSHFIAVLPMSDVAALFIPRDMMHWFDVFRAVGGLQTLALTLQLMVNGIDARVVWWSVARLSLSLLRFAHAAWGVWKHFDWEQRDALRRGPVAIRKNIVSKFVFGSCSNLYRYVTALPGPQRQYNEFVSAFVFVTWAATVRSTHNTYGEVRVEGPLTSFQAADAFGFFLKNFFLERLLSALPNPTSTTGMRKRAAWYLLMATVLAVQWPFFFTMFSEAPLPYVHAGAEVSLFMLAYSRWRMATTPRRSSPRVSPVGSPTAGGMARVQ